MCPFLKAEKVGMQKPTQSSRNIWTLLQENHVPQARIPVRVKASMRLPQAEFSAPNYNRPLNVLKNSILLKHFVLQIWAGRKPRSSVQTVTQNRRMFCDGKPLWARTSSLVDSKTCWWWCAAAQHFTRASKKAWSGKADMGTLFQSTSKTWEHPSLHQKGGPGEGTHVHQSGEHHISC